MTRTLVQSLLLALAELNRRYRLTISSILKRTFAERDLASRRNDATKGCWVSPLG
ncbi:MAG: hypothetical protein ACRC14_04430 [Paracoccaceae bacterium]